MILEDNLKNENELTNEDDIKHFDDLKKWLKTLTVTCFVVTIGSK